MKNSNKKLRHKLMKSPMNTLSIRDRIAQINIRLDILEKDNLRFMKWLQMDQKKRREAQKERREAQKERRETQSKLEATANTLEETRSKLEATADTLEETKGKLEDTTNRLKVVEDELDFTANIIEVAHEERGQLKANLAAFNEMFARSVSGNS